MSPQTPINSYPSDTPLSAKKRLLEITKKKFHDIIHRYLSLYDYKKKHGTWDDDLDSEMCRLRDRMRKFSFKQKRFRQQLLHHNNNNQNINNNKPQPQQHQQHQQQYHPTQPKEDPIIDTTKELFLEALGLVTKEASIKLKNKSTERKRRKTANPKYSHEAATKRQVSLLKKPDKKVRLPKPPAPAGPAVKHAPQASSEELMINEERELLAQRITLLSRLAILKDQVQKKQERNDSINKENERIRRRGLDIIAAVNLFSRNILFEEDIDMKCEETLDQLD